MKNPISYFLLSLLLIILISCGNEAENNTGEGSKNFSQNRNIVRIRGGHYTLEEFRAYLRYETMNLEDIELNEEILSFYLERFIEHKLLLQEAKKHNIRISEEELQSKIEELGRYVSSDKEGVNKTEKLINDQGWVEHLEDILIVQKYVEIVLTTTVVVNQEEEKDYYNKHYQKISSQRNYRLSQIVVLDKKLAMELSEKLKKDRSRFPDLAKKYSITPDATQGGDIGWYTMDQLPEYIQKKLVNLRKGIISNVIESENGYLIIKLTDRKIHRKPSFYEIRDSIRAKLLQEKREKCLNDYLDNIWQEEKTRKKGISIFQDNLDFIYTPTEKI